MLRIPECAQNPPGHEVYHKNLFRYIEAIAVTRSCGQKQDIVLKRLIRKLGRRMALAMTLAYAFGLLAPALAMAMNGASAVSHCMFDVSDVTGAAHTGHAGDHANHDGSGHGMAAHHAGAESIGHANHAGPKAKLHDCCGPACLTALPAAAHTMPVHAVPETGVRAGAVLALPGRDPDRFDKPPILVLSV